MCKSCGESFHVVFNPSEKEGVCDRCGGELYQRDDDREETIRQRLAVYRDQTQPLINYYEKQGKVRRIDGTGSIEEIFSRVIGAVGN
jgi:adenylate kinase